VSIGGRTHFEAVEFLDVSDPAVRDDPVVSGADVLSYLIVDSHSILHESRLQGEIGEIAGRVHFTDASLASTRYFVFPFRPHAVSLQGYFARR